jgi:hypothetical protein
MAVDLKLTVGERYSIITLVFFVPYSQSRLVFTSAIFCPALTLPAHSRLRVAV